MPVNKKNTQTNDAIWLEVLTAAPLRMSALMKELKTRHYKPADSHEREWFDELSNLCAPLNMEAFTPVAQSFLRQSFEYNFNSTDELHEDAELTPVLIPDTSGGDYSIFILPENQLLTHSPATAGLIQVFSTPHCQQEYQLRLYSRRTSCEVSRCGKMLASKTESDEIALSSLPDGKEIRRWRHPQGEDGNSFRIEKFSDSGDLIVSDRTNVIHFLPCKGSKIRSYPGMLVRQMPLLACSNDGKLLVTPDYGKRKNTVWEIDPSQPPRTKPGSIRPEGVETLMSFDLDRLPDMKAMFSPDKKYLVLTTPIELQIRIYPYEQIIFSMEPGRDIAQPVLAFSHDSKTLAILRRTHPAELSFMDMDSVKIKRSIKLADVFSRHPLSQIVFSANNKDLLLAGQEKIYTTSSSNKTASIDQNLLKLVNTRIRDIEIEDLEKLEKTYKSKWMSMHLRPWAEMLFYLVKRRSYDIAISENEDSMDTSNCDIALAD